MATNELRQLAARQHGLITRQQATERGISRSSWYRRVASGSLLELHPGVAALEGAPPTTQRAVLAAVLSLDGAVASHRSAAYLWGADVAGDRPVDVTADRPAGGHRIGVAVHRPLDVGLARAVRRDGITCTTPVRTLVDLGAVGAVEHVRQAYEQFLVTGLVSSAATRAALERHARRGRGGVGALRAVLDEWALGSRPPDSVLETAMARLLARHRLPEPSFQHVIGGPGFSYRVDFAYPDLRIVVEVDGWRHHGHRHAFEADRRRDAVLHSLGWVVLRFTWLQVTRRPDWVAERIAATLAARTAA